MTAHIALFRRYGVTPPIGAESRPSAAFWPEQAVRNTLFCAGLLGVVITLTLIEGGTTLDAPADPSSADIRRAPNGTSSHCSRCSSSFRASARSSALS